MSTRKRGNSKQQSRTHNDNDHDDATQNTETTLQEKRRRLIEDEDSAEERSQLEPSVIAITDHSNAQQPSLPSTTTTTTTTSNVFTAPFVDTSNDPAMDVQEDEEVEEFYVVLELPDHEDTSLLLKSKKFSTLGMDTDEPFLKIDDRAYRGHFEDTVGTHLLFKATPESATTPTEPNVNNNSESPSRSLRQPDGVIPKFSGAKYFCHATKVVKFRRVALEPKDTEETRSKKTKKNTKKTKKKTKEKKPKKKQKTKDKQPKSPDTNNTEETTTAQPVVQVDDEPVAPVDLEADSAKT